MALTPRAIRIEVERIVFDGVSPDDRAAFARAFEIASATALAGAEFGGGARALERVDVRFAAGCDPEAFASALADGIAKALVR
jgi:hypothetical protein